ncbi:unnamed protein product [Sphenostylis stenocarpa]|uniref:Uncharacterized protein n=1 Tax=Sphenostylis stenocarpa TaxID=92480 RepID=A0AA86VRV1_9FABA|nr:unnamed protein product [Sphenostylis stenocarpa]
MITSSKEEAVLKWDCGSLLYDSHELISLAYTIERHMIVWPHLRGSNPIITKLCDPKEKRPTESVSKISSMATNFSAFFKRMWKKMKEKHEKIQPRAFGFCVGVEFGMWKWKPQFASMEQVQLVLNPQWSISN